MGCYVMVGLASRRILLHPTTDHMVAQVFRLQQPHGGETSIRVRAWKCPLFFNKCKTLLLGLNWYLWWGFFFIQRPNKAVKIDSVLWLTLFFCFPFFFFFYGPFSLGILQMMFNVVYPMAPDQRRHVSINSARWLPEPGMGLAYGTNKGDLVICRPV